MVELRTLHLTDIHDDFEKYQVIADYIASKKDSEQAVDAVFITGDFIEGDFKIKGKTAQKITEGIESLSGSAEEKELQILLEKYQKDGKVDLSSVDETAKKEIEALGAKMDAMVKEAVKKVVAESYQKHADALGKIEIPTLGTLGNHDLTIGYNILKDKIKFVEREKQISIKGKSSLEFLVKGDLNTWEVPPMYAKLAELLKEDFIPYLSGYSLAELSKEVNGLQKKVNESSEEQRKELQKNLEQTTEVRKKVLDFYLSEFNRLGTKNEVDIYLTHKLPSCKKANPKIQGPLNDLTVEYAQNAKAVYGGHFHDGQIGYKTIEDFLKQESTEKTTIDGVEVPVYYLDENESWELNPGTNYFFVTEYDANKEIEQVVIYEFYYEDVA